MNPIVDYTLTLLQSGWMSLLDYLAAHVLLCLVPAFFIAGALSALIVPAVIINGISGVCMFQTYL
jgi:uncharacterized membrane protein YraQ (UPF0718 family)